MWWIIGGVFNGVTAIAYVAIAAAILGPLVRERQLSVNRLGTATALIFFTCAVHHGGHVLKVLIPFWSMSQSLGLAASTGIATRMAFDWQSVSWDLVMAAVGIYYWSLRRVYGPLMRGAKLFEDLKEQQRRALEINDNIVQGLTVAQIALHFEEHERTSEALEATLVAARRIINDLFGELGQNALPEPGTLVRREAASLRQSRS